MEFALPSRSWFKLPLDFFMALWTHLPNRGAARSLCANSQHRASAGLSELQQSALPQARGHVRGGADAFSRRPTRRMVRVIQVLDSSQPQGGSGRIRISGTMEEVCAELDRLIWQDRQSLAPIHRLH